MLKLNNLYILTTILLLGLIFANYYKKLEIRVKILEDYKIHHMKIYRVPSYQQSNLEFHG